MEMYQTAGVVLRAVDYRERDRMLTLLSPDHGRIDAIAHACRRVKSPLLNACEVFCSGEYGIRDNAGRKTIITCSIGDAFYPLRLDYDVLKNAVYCASLCAKCAQPDLPAHEMYSLLLNALAHFAYGDTRPGRVTAFYLYALSRVLGIAPELALCVRCGALPGSNPAFDFAGGGVCCAKCGPGLPSANTSSLDVLRDAGPLSLSDMLRLPAGDEDVRWARDIMRVFVEARIGAGGSAM